MTFLVRFWSDEAGASAAEYAMIIAVVGAGIAVAAFALGDKIGNSITKYSNCVGEHDSVSCS